MASEGPITGPKRVSSASEVSLADGAFQQEWASFVESTRTVVEGKDDYSPMVVVVTERVARMNVLFSEDGSELKGPADLNELLFAMGRDHAWRNRDAIGVITASAWGNVDDKPFITINGVSADGEERGIVIDLRRDADGTLHAVGERAHPTGIPSGASAWWRGREAGLAVPRPWWRRLFGRG
jgi:hypothetical protein